MGASHGHFVEYPRTPHLFGSKGTDDGKHFGETASNGFIADDSLTVEEKLDGTNIGIHFSDSDSQNRLDTRSPPVLLMCRGLLPCTARA